MTELLSTRLQSATELTTELLEDFARLLGYLPYKTKAEFTGYPIFHWAAPNSLPCPLPEFHNGQIIDEVDRRGLE